MTTDQLLSHVHEALARADLLSPAKLFVVAVSGGPDSLCLLHLLWRLRATGGPPLHVAHLDHGFRGAQSAEEAAFVAHTARSWGLPATVEQHDLPARIRASHENSQAAARSVRYQFLARVARQTGAAAVALGHQADDQAETVLLHLLHGAGPAGLRGMRALLPWEAWQPQPAAHDHDHDDHEQKHNQPAPDASPRPVLLRPLLSISRSQIEAYCNKHGLEPRRDPSNEAARYRRSRIRGELLPLLASFNPQIVAALQRTAAICADDYAYLQSQLDTHWPTLASHSPGAIRFAATAWAALPVALQRYALRRATELLTGSDGLSYEHVEGARAATSQPPGHQHSLPAGLLLRIEAAHVLLLHQPTYQPPDPAARYPHLPQLAADQLTLHVPGITPLSASWYAEASRTPPAHAPDPTNTLPAAWDWSVILDADTLDGPLLLRRRQPGDRFRPAGGRGSRRLQDLFVDSKLPRELRDRWPLLATPHSILWVAGLRADARFQPTPHTRHRLWITLRQHTDQQPGMEWAFQ